MPYQENNLKLLEEAKLLLFETMPQSISIFDREDGTFIVYAEFADYIIVQIDNKQEVKKAIKIIEEVLSKEKEVLYDLIIIQIFQKIYPLKDVIEKFRKILPNNILELFDKYHVAFNKPIQKHPFLDELGDSRVVFIDE